MASKFKTVLMSFSEPPRLQNKKPGPRQNAQRTQAANGPRALKYKHLLIYCFLKPFYFGSSSDLGTVYVFLPGDQVH